MFGNDDISKTLKMMHEAARFEFSSNNFYKGIDILNDARIIEQKMGFKNQAAETMIEISGIYFRLKNYDLAVWFAEEASEILVKTKKTSTLEKATHLLSSIKEESNCEVFAN